MARSVVMVEDDPTLRNAYQIVLAAEGFEVVAARDGREGLKLAASQEPDLILLDMLMPNVNGMEFLREFDAKNRHPHTKIIVFSNIADSKEEQEALELGASLYLIKADYAAKQLMGVIKQVLQPKSGTNEANSPTG